MANFNRVSLRDWIIVAMTIMAFNTVNSSHLDAAANNTNPCELANQSIRKYALSDAGDFPRVKLVELTFLNKSVHFPMISNQQFLHQVNNTLKSMEDQINQLAQQNSVQRQKCARKIQVLCVEDVRKKARFLNIDFNSKFRNIQKQINSLLKGSNTTNETHCLLCISGFVEDSLFLGVDILFNITVERTKEKTTPTTTATTPTAPTAAGEKTTTTNVAAGEYTTMTATKTPEPTFTPSLAGLQVPDFKKDKPATATEATSTSNSLPEQVTTEIPPGPANEKNPNENESDANRR